MNRRRRNTFLLALGVSLTLSCGPSAFSAIPEGYYANASGLSLGPLKTALCGILAASQQPVSNYSKAYTDLRTTFQHTDLYPGSERWWDMYSDIPLYAPSFSGLNREHSFPKSWWGGSQTVPAYVDLNHLYPAEAAANQKKSNWPLGRVATAKFDNGITRVGYPVGGQGGGASQVFEPDDEYKGDFARTYFYMATRYQDMTWAYTWQVDQNLYPTLNQWSQTLLMAWHRGDPVSQKELDRNDAVYALQGNRNPFIDYPELAELLWGDRRGQAFDPGESGPVGPSAGPVLDAPQEGMYLEMGEVALGSSTACRLRIHGTSIPGDLTVMLAGEDAAAFRVATSTVQAAPVNSADGYLLTVTYAPGALGEHTARLLIGDFDPSRPTTVRTVVLRGQCLEVPELTALQALDPSDITADSYVANWLAAPLAQDVDYYVLTRTLYLRSGGTHQEEYDVEYESLQVDDFDQSLSETYNVQSVRLGYRSEPSNTVTVSHTGISCPQAADGLPLWAVAIPGGLRLECAGVTHTAVTVADVQGRVVAVLSQATDAAEILLPPGVYLVRTAQHPRPLKVAVEGQQWPQ